MRTPSIHAVLAAAALAGIPAVACAQQSPQLQYKWTKGQSIHYRMTQHDTITTAGVPGISNLVVNQKNSCTTRFDVMSVSPGGAANLRLTWQGFRVETNHPKSAPAIWDSANAGQHRGQFSPVARALGAVVGQSITFSIAPDGTVSNIQGCDAVLQRAVAAHRATGSKSGLATIERTFSHSAVHAMLQQNFRQLPARNVKKGESFNSNLTQNLPLFGAAQASAKWTFAGNEPCNGVQAAKLTSSHNLRWDAPSAPASPAKADMKNGKGSAEFFFDPATGQLCKSVTRAHAPMSLVLAGNNGRDTRITQTIDSTITLERINPANNAHTSVNTDR